MTASLKDKLAARRPRSTTYPLAVADTAEVEAELERAQTAHRRAVMEHDPESAEVTEAKAAVDEATELEAACYEHVVITALPATEFEVLVDTHPAQSGEDTPWHTATFRPALLAACIDADMSAGDWDRFFRTAGTQGDLYGLFSACLEVNNRTPSPTLPKDSTRTGN